MNEKVTNFGFVNLLAISNILVNDLFLTKFIFDMFESEAISLVEKKISLPAYDQCLKASHIFNILDARGAISVAQRAEYISRIREITKSVAAVWIDSQV